MFTFFRKIRQKLITEGKLKNYLFYALGEVLLIIVGILIALQISNWNEQRKVMDKHQVYLTNLHKDVQSTIEGLNNFEKWNNDFNDASMPVIEFLESDKSQPLDKIAFEEGLIQIRSFAFPQVHIGLLGQLLEGDTELIKLNSDLAKSALDMEGNVKRHIEVVTRISRNLEDMHKTQRQYIGYPIIRGTTEIVYDLAKMTAQPDFKFSVMNSIASRRGMVLYSNMVRDALEAFQLELEKALKKKVD